MIASSSLVDSVIRSSALEPRDYQHRIISKSSDFYRGLSVTRSGDRLAPAASVMIESPTGSGKTPTGLALNAVMQANPKLFGAKKITSVWVAMRKELLEQARDEVEEHKIPVEITTLSMFATRIPEHLLNLEPGHKLMLNVDECQHDATDSMATLHSTLLPKGRESGYVLGLSATPFRTDRMRLCFERVVKDANIRQLVQAGYLSPFDHFTIPNFEPETVAQFYARDPARWGKSAVYFHNSDQCERFKAALAVFGHRTEIITGDSDRATQLAAFHRGEFQVATNMMVLTEGWDCPDLKTVFVRDSVKGPTMQMAGRVFRKHASAPVKNVVQSQETKYPMVRAAKPIHQYVWELGQWMSLTLNERIDEISDAMMKKLATVNVQMPKSVLCGKKKSWPPKAPKDDE